MMRTISRLLWLRPAASLAAAALIALCVTTPAKADTAHSGWDLFQTAPGTTFDGVAFTGVPLGTFDFGSGGVATGATDTIVHRLLDVTAPPGGSGATDLVMEALQLVTAAPVPANTFGAGTPAGNYYITLTAGAPSTGTMTINFANPTPGPPPPTQPLAGTFDSSINVNFDLRFGSLAGPIEASGSLTLTSSGTPWSHYPPPGALLIDGVNHNLAGQRDPTQDFFVIGLVDETEPGATHIVMDASVPEPSTVVTGVIGLIFGAVLIRRSSRRGAA